jgi:hypothetical protein
VYVEQALFERTGHPIAYIADDGEDSVYLWSGDAVAYVLEGRVFGWNGRHLGFFVNGLVCDVGGRVVGSTAARCPGPVHAEPVKFTRREKRRKYSRYEASAFPTVSGEWASQSLKSLLVMGAVARSEFP